MFHGAYNLIKLVINYSIYSVVPAPKDVLPVPLIIDLVPTTVDISLANVEKE